MQGDRWVSAQSASTHPTNPVLRRMGGAKRYPSHFVARLLIQQARLGSFLDIVFADSRRQQTLLDQLFGHLFYTTLIVLLCYK